MNRKDFFKKTCAMGICGCAGLGIFNTQSVSAQNPEEKEDWRIGFMQKRFAKLIEMMNIELDAEERNLLLEEMGRACAKENDKNAKAVFALLLIKV